MLITPSVGLIPTMPCRPAGTRPEPAVSVPIAMSASPVATATADPELDPPLMNSGLRLSGTAPYGERVPTRPVANWSRLVLPTTTAPAARNAATDAGVSVGRVGELRTGRGGGQSGRVDVVLHSEPDTGQRALDLPPVLPPPLSRACE